MSTPLAGPAYGIEGNTLFTPLHVGIWCAVLFALCALVGRRQRRQVQASVARLLAVAAAAAVVASMPAVPALLLGEQLDLSWGTRVAIVSEEAGADDGTVPASPRRVTTRPVEGLPEPAVLGVGYAGATAPVNVLVVLLMLLVAARTAVAVMRPAPQLAGVHGGQLPQVIDEATVARIRALAAQVGAPAPRLLRLGSLGGTTQVSAYTGGSITPVLVVSDGVLDRLDDDDVAAILAHELAHVARRSFDVLVLAVCGGCTLAVLLSAVLPPILSLAVGFALLTVFPIVFGHFDEPAADLRAARAVGFDAMARALGKVHAANAPPCGPWLRRLLHATQPHPSEAVRRAHLRAHAPPDAGPELAHERAEAGLQKRIDRAALALLAAALGFALWTSLHRELLWYGAGAAVGIVLVPRLVLFAALERRLWHAWRIGAVRVPWRALAATAAFVGCVALAVAGLYAPWAWPTWLALAAMAAIAADDRRHRRALARLHGALRAQDLAAGLRALDALPGRRRGRPVARLTRARLLAAQRADDAALAELDALVARHPRFWPAHLVRCAIVRATDPRRALALADHVAAKVPANPYALANRAQSLRRLGRCDEAAAAIAEAIALDPAAPSLYTVQAQVALGSGDAARAAPLVALANERDPASTLLPLLDAELHLLRGERQAAAAALQRAERTVAQDRLSLAGYELDRVRRKLAEHSG